MEPIILFQHAGVFANKRFALLGKALTLPIQEATIAGKLKIT